MEFPVLNFVLSEGVHSLSAKVQEAAQSTVACLIEELELIEESHEGMFTLLVAGKSFCWKTEPVDSLTNQKQVWLALQKE